MKEFLARVSVKFVGLSAIAILAWPWICGDQEGIRIMMETPITAADVWFCIPLFGGILVLSVALTLVLYTKEFI